MLFCRNVRRSQILRSRRTERVLLRLYEVECRLNKRMFPIRHLLSFASHIYSSSVFLKNIFIIRQIQSRIISLIIDKTITNIEPSLPV